MIAFARLNPDAPGKLVAHAFSYEHMELAAYELLGWAARRAQEPAVEELAQEISGQEQSMADRLEHSFDRAVDASLREKSAEAIRAELVSYLRDARAIEAQALQLLWLGSRVAGVEPLADAFRAHHAETREHQSLVEARLRAHGAGPSRLQDTALRLGALNLGAFFAVQPDTPVKLAGFAFAFEHLEIAAYELLKRVAERAGDGETVAVGERILLQERSAAARITDTWEAAMDAALQKLATPTPAP